MQVLDHFYLKLRNRCFATVVGNMHTSSNILGYIKYCPSRLNTTWCDQNTCYERIVKTYNADSVHASTSHKIYVHFFDALVPCISMIDVDKVHNPLERARSLFNKVNDNLEKTALYLISEIWRDTGHGENIGITGSLLIGIHNPDISDIDVVVYGTRQSMDIVEYIRENKEIYKPFNGARLEKWIEANSKATGLSKQQVLRFYRNWRRGIYMNREYSIIYNNGVYEDMALKPPFKTLGSICIEVELDKSVDGLNYPSMGKVLSYRIVGQSSVDIPYDIVEVLSFEALYIPGLYEGGIFIVEGLLQCSDQLGACRVLIGGREYPGRLYYIE
ncbi:MAG: nucleotidyltransferase domain-containing protein [Desulfurococcaceae archaeon]